MTAPTIHLQSLPQVSREGGPWRVYLVNTTTRHAFYEAVGCGRGEVTIRYGRIGAIGRSQTYSYSKALERLHAKRAADYSHTDNTPLNQPLTAQPVVQRVRTLRERLGNTSMRPTTSEELLTRGARDKLYRVHADEDFTDVFRGADRVSILQADDGHLIVVARYDTQLVLGRVDGT